MKKSILSFVFVLVLATVASAAPRFGVIGEQTSGLGAFITDDMYNAQVTYSSTNTKVEVGGASAEAAQSQIKIGGNYKIALDSVTALTAGVNYAILNSDVDGYDKGNTLAISAGFERALSSNIVLTTQADVYNVNTVELENGQKTTVTALLSNGRVGVAYLF